MSKYFENASTFFGYTSDISRILSDRNYSLCLHRISLFFQGAHSLCSRSVSFPVPLSYAASAAIQAHSLVTSHSISGSHSVPSYPLGLHHLSSYIQIVYLLDHLKLFQQRGSFMQRVKTFLDYPEYVSVKVFSGWAPCVKAPLTTSLLPSNCFGTGFPVSVNSSVIS